MHTRCHIAAPLAKAPQAGGPAPLRIGAALALAGLLAGCSTGGYPSLRPRAEEQASYRTTPPEAPRPPEALSADLGQQLARLVEEARQGHAAFLARLPHAEAALAANGDSPAGTSSWSEANEALAELDTARAPAGQALAAITRLYVDDRLDHALDDAAAGNGLARPAGARLDAAQAQVAALVAEEDGKLAALQARLPG
ncbi:MAG TPA: hypothetical protein VFF98_13555 [Novosphingobium sp.]|nr:hypothetical protein [Novosphingobium sp.]